MIKILNRYRLRRNPFITGYLFASIFTINVCTAASCFAENAHPTLKPVWEKDEINHQNEAKGVFCSDDYIYIGQGGPEGRISKVNIRDGEVVWTYKNQSYQPSYPVSNGQVVAFGTYYATPDEKEHISQNHVIFLDDKNGKFIHKVPTGTVMAAVTFFDDKLFAGNNDGEFFAIDWRKGDVIWKTKLGHYFWAKPVIYQDLVLIGSYDGFLYALNQNSGELKWKIDCGGAINANPLLSNDLILVMANTQPHSYTSYDSSKEQTVLKAIDLTTQEVIETFTTESQWKYKIVREGNDVYFFDSVFLYSYNTSLRDLNWKFKAAGGLAPYPFISDNSIVLPMNYLEYHGQHNTTMVWVDKDTGKEIMQSDTGGIGVRGDNYVQFNDTLVITEWKLRAYQLQ